MKLDAYHMLGFLGERYLIPAVSIAEAAGQLIGLITAGEALSRSDTEVLLFHLSGMMNEPFVGSKSQLAIELAVRAAPAFGRHYPDYRELLVKHMLCCIQCEGSPCILGEDDPAVGWTANADMGISAEEYAELNVLAEEAKKRSKK